jgi:hypothetical protein
MNRIIVIFLICLNSLSAFSQKELEFSCDVKQVKSKMEIDGKQLFYALPKNSIQVEVEIKKTTQIEGPYSGFALKYLNISEGTIQMDDEFFTLVSAKFHRISQVDSSAFFAVNYEGYGGFPALQLNADGVILGCNVKEPIQGYATAVCAELQIETELENFLFLDLGIKSFLEETEETKYKTIQTDSTPIKIPIASSKLVPTSVEVNAESAAEFIRKLRKRRLKLIYGDSGETFAVEGESMKKMVEELDAYEQKYLELFIGKTIERSFTYYFSFVPDDKSDSEQQVLAWFSRSKGLELSKSETRKGDFQALTLTSNLISKIPEPKVQTIDQKQKSSVPVKFGLYYRIPGRIDAMLQYGDKTLTRQQIEIAQKGVIIPMPVDYLNSPNYSIEFYPETGALKRIYSKN